VLFRAQTGSSRLVLDGRDAVGRPMELVFGPSPVFPALSGFGRGWQRFGREWGAQLRFPRAGCWRLSIEAGDQRGGLTVLAVPPR
jgi:hypothetical protein